MTLVVSKIDRDAIRQQRLTIIHVTIFDGLGRETITIPISASQFKGNLEVGQELVLVPREQINI